MGAGFMATDRASIVGSIWSSVAAAATLHAVGISSRHVAIVDHKEAFYDTGDMPRAPLQLRRLRNSWR